MYYNDTWTLWDTRYLPATIITIPNTETLNTPESGYLRPSAFHSLNPKKGTCQSEGSDIKGIVIQEFEYVPLIWALLSSSLLWWD